jgi:predicted acylesterase/phospholipase RssA
MTWQQFGRLLRVVFLLRVPLFLLIALAAFGPVSLTLLDELLGNLLDLGPSHWYMFLVSLASFLLAFAAIAVINLIFSYGEDRLGDPSLKLVQSHPVITFFLGSTPAVILLACVWVRTSGTESRFIGKLVFSLLGLGVALAVVVVSKGVQLALTDPSATPYPPPYLVFPAYLIPPLELRFDAIYCWSSDLSKRLKRGFNRVVQWPLGILRGAGEGYFVDLNPPADEPLMLRSGHVFVLSLSLIAFGFYVGIGYRKAYITASGPGVPALAYLLLFAIVLCWGLSALTFFFDRYRFPLISVLALVILVTPFAPISDHFFRVVSLDHQIGRLSTPTEVLRRRLGGPHKRLIFVATAGGGIQAAAWTVRVLTGLEEECGKDCDFRSSVAVISSVSGGSLGSMIYAERYSDRFKSRSNEELLRQSETSALDEVAWGWTNPDVARALSPVHWSREIDRGWALERKWAEVNGLRDTHVGTADTLLSTWTEEGTPALIFNSMIVETGAPIVFSNSDFARSGNGRGIKNFYDLYPDKNNLDVRVNTAVRLSASFPYVAPAARPNVRSPMSPDYHFVDGGYYDNYGINSLIEWLDDAFRNDSNLPAQLPEILILQITPFDVGPEKKPTEHGWGFQIVAPFLALLEMRDTTQKVRDLSELRLFAKYFKSKGIGVWTAHLGFPGRDRSALPSLPDKDQCARPPLSWKLDDTQAGCISDKWNTLQKSQSHAIACVKSYLNSDHFEDKCLDASNDAITEQ